MPTPRQLAPSPDADLDAMLAQLQRPIVAAISRGATRTLAARVVGWTEAQFADVLARAEQPGASPGLVRFRLAIDQAEACYEVSLLGALTAAAHAGDRGAAAWLLERADKATHERGSAGGVVVLPAEDPEGSEPLDLSGLSDEQLDRLARGERPDAATRAAMQGGAVPPGPLTPKDLEKMSGAQLVTLVQQGRIMPTGPTVYRPEETNE